jgi:hypothetical protein
MNEGFGSAERDPWSARVFINHGQIETYNAGEDAEDGRNSYV